MMAVAEVSVDSGGVGREMVSGGDGGSEGGGVAVVGGGVEKVVFDRR